MNRESVEKGQVYQKGNEDYFYVAGISEYAVHFVHISQGAVMIPNLCVQKKNIEKQSGELTDLDVEDLELPEKVYDRIERLEEAILNNHPDAVPDQEDF